jgi:hypothetical protein
VVEGHNFSDEEIEAVREFGMRSFLSGRDERIALLTKLELWNNSRSDLNERGSKIKGMLIGAPHASHAELALMFQYTWGKNSREGRILLETQLLEMDLAWVTEQGHVLLNIRGEKVRTDAYWLRH